jgi:hypothetical protein
VANNRLIDVKGSNEEDLESMNLSGAIIQKENMQDSSPPHSYIQFLRRARYS